MQLDVNKKQARWICPSGLLMKKPFLGGGYHNNESQSKQDDNKQQHTRSKTSSPFIFSFMPQTIESSIQSSGDEQYPQSHNLDINHQKDDDKDSHHQQWILHHQFMQE